MTGFVGYITGAQHGVAVPAVLASQFAAVAAFVSFLFRERLSRTQACGSDADGGVAMWCGAAGVITLQGGVSQLLSSSSSRRRGTAWISFF